MGIKSGTITHTCGEFYLEAATGSEELDTRFEHYINYFTSEGDIPVDSVEISRIGEFNGGWKFWDDLYRQEREITSPSNLSSSFRMDQLTYQTGSLTATV